MDGPALVDDEHRPDAGPSFVVPHIVGLAYLTLGVEIRQLRIGKSAQGSAPRTVSRWMIHAYAQNLGIFLLDPAVVSPERGSLACSTSCKAKDMEGQDYVLVAFVLAQAHLLIGG